MMMGPEPMSRIFLRSVLLGMESPRDGSCQRLHRFERVFYPRKLASQATSKRLPGSTGSLVAGSGAGEAAVGPQRRRGPRPDRGGFWAASRVLCYHPDLMGGLL